MGMFDYVRVWSVCPFCKDRNFSDSQTKDLDCCLYTFDALEPDWYTSKRKLERKFRKGLPVFKRFPADKEDRVWKNQAERIEAQATISKEFKKLKYIEVLITCESKKCKCKKQFEGKIKIKNGMLIGEPYDIKKY